MSRSPLRIVIDARRIRDFGIGTYIRNLARALSKVNQSDHFTLITGTEDVPELAGLGSNFEITRFRGASRPLLSNLTFPLFLRRHAADLYHIPLNAVPFGMLDPYVVTIHDMGNFRYASHQGFRQNFRFSRFRRGLERAARVIAVSNATRLDVDTLFGIAGSRVQTIYNAPDPAFIAPSQETALDNQRIMERYQIHYPFLLYAGRTNPQKNIPRLVEAFAVLKGELASHPVYRDLRLIIIGDEISKYPALRHAVIQSRVEASVRFLGFVPIETLRVFYQVAAAFVFPSLFEGFGLPPLEAMASGTPVVCSHLSALPEVVGDAAMVINPENVFDIARGVREVLLDERLRASLIEKGLNQVKRFSWETTASQVMDVYREAAAG